MMTGTVMMTMMRMMTMMTMMMMMMVMMMMMTTLIIATVMKMTTNMMMTTKSRLALALRHVCYDVARRFEGWKNLKHKTPPIFLSIIDSTCLSESLQTCENCIGPKLNFSNSSLQVHA